MLKETFLNKIKEKYPDNSSKYDYSLLPNEFKALDKIPIICPKHGIFNQLSFSHSKGIGCNKCGTIRTTNFKRIDILEFIKRANSKHNNKYDYSKTIYIDSKTKVIITCSTHGDFLQTPNDHLSGYRCSKCSKVYKPSTEEFIRKAKLIHENKYDYSLVKYINSKTKIKILCKEHNFIFDQTPDSHLNGKGCRKCAGNNKSSTEEFVCKANEIHYNFYTYPRFKYDNGKTKGIITCLNHGDFLQTPNNHLRGQGCPICKSIKLSILNSSNVEKFINKANLIHNNKYSYNKVVYINSDTKVIITCSTHGDFLQTPDKHLSGQGCPICKESHGERHVTQTLDKYNIRYIREYNIKPHRYRYDFYLPDYDIYIEYHGEQHYKYNHYYSTRNNFDKTQKNDLIKIELIKRSTGLLITIKYTFNTLEKIEDELIRLFSIIHSQFLFNKELVKQSIIDSNIYLIQDGIVYIRNH